ncbi:MAG: GH3 auxin-responsive promoter family protein [Dehalococcoidia bacterium]|nr:GH3 auxin-responsive promoter family protein [Dehalococcoidia bacterium]
MSKIQELLQQRMHEELWHMCCGFIDLSLEEFMIIQRRLLLEQINFLKDCELGRKVMGAAMPDTVEGFREQVPLTTYADYCPELLERRDDVLPAKPIHWARTSGKSAEYPCKWIPISRGLWDEMGPVLCATRLFATCRRRGEVAISTNSRVLYATAPLPYISGVIASKSEEEFGFRYFPSPRESEGMPFMERLEKGFWMALSEGMDGFYGLSGVLVAIGERFKQGASNVNISPLLSRPKALLRLIKAKIKSRLERRPMLPKDLWSIRGISCGGTDGVVYRDKIEAMWGVRPLDVYAGTEGLIIAMQTWDYTGMTFIPNLNFLEFIPEDEHFKWLRDHSYQPKTVLLNEVKPGQSYEIVITNFHGGAMVRYRIGDMVRITALRNENLGIEIPQMVFDRRADDLIDIAGFTRLTERVIWQAIENTGIPYIDWTGRKEVIDKKPMLHLYIELKDDYIASEKGMASAVHDQLKRLNSDYADLESMLGLVPLEVTLLSTGSFAAFIAKRVSEGADLAHLKPRHINPSDEVFSILLGTDAKEPMPEAKVAAEAKTKSGTLASR